ncbi:aldo/keto reductase, putative [Talaromyces stipitatus ATCC 10500]|uniref:Aldo/keto reductase, putative n=1 Tax=Talaromyces stipitatus (strain ATCC 10500 / CBS 375.48 / QM 6759 / NRRL 1006) TaxID=441959 RepID=B8MFN0_TALSN|nr:aldo/keto reductase, putative [Talaromyces stipitatus ATCC 10500]EED17020.1 aldo/keto reductase, putative [Talaromyces stipitatus ATCC 10500]
MPCLAGKEITQNGLGLSPISQSFHCRWRNRLEWRHFYGTPDNNSLHLMNRYFTTHPEDTEKVMLCIKTGVKEIDILGCARTDTAVPVEESIKALAEMEVEGKNWGFQLSEVRAETIRRAVALAKINMVEAELKWVTAICGELTIVLAAHTPLGAGMLTGQVRSLDDVPANGYHRYFPRWQPGNFDKDLLLVRELDAYAKEKGCTTSQLVEWDQNSESKTGYAGPCSCRWIKICEKNIRECKNIDLTDGDLTKLNSILKRYPVAGDRYPRAGQALAEY